MSGEEYQARECFTREGGRTRGAASGPRLHKHARDVLGAPSGSTGYAQAVHGEALFCGTRFISDLGYPFYRSPGEERQSLADKEASELGKLRLLLLMLLPLAAVRAFSCSTRLCFGRP